MNLPIMNLYENIGNEFQEEDKLIDFLVLSCLIDIKITKLVHNITIFNEFLNRQASLTGFILSIQLFPWNIR